MVSAGLLAKDFITFAHKTFVPNHKMSRFFAIHRFLDEFGAHNPSFESPVIVPANVTESPPQTRMIRRVILNIVR